MLAPRANFACLTRNHSFTAQISSPVTTRLAHYLQEEKPPSTRSRKHSADQEEKTKMKDKNDRIWCHLLMCNCENAGENLRQLIDSEIARYTRLSYANPKAVVPWFPKALEDRFNADTGSARARDLRFTTILGTIFFFLTTVTDFAFVPDIGWQGFWLRVMASPLLIVTLTVGPSMKPTGRELLAAATSFAAVVVSAIIPCLSSSPWALLSIITPMFVIVYSNTTLGLRFSEACGLTLLSCTFVTAAAVFKLGAGDSVAWSIGVLTWIAGAFSIVANCWIERSARLGYLLNTRETMRLSVIAADREKLKTLSDTDALTGLTNRGSFNTRCLDLFLDPSNSGVSAALMMVDVDHFKQFNDFYGHVAGDTCLRTVAQQISSAIRGRNDIVARYGGEEFIVFLLGVTPAQAEVLAERICASVRSLDIPHLNRDDGTEIVTISVGVATATIESGASLIGLIEAADRALYDAKRNGRDRCEAALPQAA